jgi:hypothetical protein
MVKTLFLPALLTTAFCGNTHAGKGSGTQGICTQHSSGVCLIDHPGAPYASGSGDKEIMGSCGHDETRNGPDGEALPCGGCYLGGTVPE